MVSLQYFYHFSQNYKKEKKNYSKINTLSLSVLQMVRCGNEIHMFKLYDL